MNVDDDDVNIEALKLDTDYIKNALAPRLGRSVMFCEFILKKIVGKCNG